MKKVALIFSLLAVCGMIMGCGSDDDDGGPSCKAMLECDPACAMDGTEYCNPLTGNCDALTMCDPACDVATEYCDMVNGGVCRAACDPACGNNQYCDDGTCKDAPVCDPPCAATEMCVG